MPMASEVAITYRLLGLYPLRQLLERTLSTDQQLGSLVPVNDVYKTLQPESLARG